MIKCPNYAFAIYLDQQKWNPASHLQDSTEHINDIQRILLNAIRFQILGWLQMSIETNLLEWWNYAYNILLWCLIVSFTLVEYNMRYLLTFFVFKLWIVVVDLFHTSYRMLHYMSQWWYTMIHRLIQYIFSLKCNPRTFVLLFKTSPNEMKTNTNAQY